MYTLRRHVPYRKGLFTSRSTSTLTCFGLCVRSCSTQRARKYLTLERFGVPANTARLEQVCPRIPEPQNHALGMGLSRVMTRRLPITIELSWSTSFFDTTSHTFIRATRSISSGRSCLVELLNANADHQTTVFPDIPRKSGE